MHDFLIAFLGGLLLGIAVVGYLYVHGRIAGISGLIGQVLNPTTMFKTPAIFLVGFGTRLGSGCTSGHGICGISRLSKRSIVATMSFMFAGFVTVYMIRHITGAF